MKQDTTGTYVMYDIFGKWIVDCIIHGDKQHCYFYIGNQSQTIGVQLLEKISEK